MILSGLKMITAECKHDRAINLYDQGLWVCRDCNASGTNIRMHNDVTKREPKSNGRLQRFKEDLVVTGIFLGLLFPLRLFFYHYLQNYWIGAFGVVAIVMLALFYFSKKGKLGKLGTMIMNYLRRRTTGKRFKSMLGFGIIFIYISSLIVVGNIFADPNGYTQVTNELKKEGITDVQSLEKYNKAHPPTVTVMEWLQGLAVMATPNQFSFIFMKAANSLTNGWLLTFCTIALVEDIELISILVYLRHKIK